MIDAILNGLMGFIIGILNPFLSAVDGIILSIFPNVGDIVLKAYSFINTVCDCVVYVLDLLPSNFIDSLLLIIDIELLYLSACISYIGLSRIFRLLKNINPFS